MTQPSGHRAARRRCYRRARTGIGLCGAAGARGGHATQVGGLSTARYYRDLFGASHLIPYDGTNPVERRTARVTLAFFDRYVLGQADALKTMTRDGNVTGAALVSDGQPPP